jgi:ABC-type cobalt transport system substrate-binding protein
MTCIVGIAANGKVFMGADKCASDTYSKIVYRYPKVFKKKVEVHNGPEEEMLFGCADSFRMMQLLQYSFIPPLYYPSSDPLEYLVTDFMDEVRDMCKEKGLFLRGQESETVGGQFLLGFKGEIYHIDEALQVISVSEQELTLGAGADFALGSLFSTRKRNLAPRTRIKEALECAATYNPQTNAEVDFLEI